MPKGTEASTKDKKFYKGILLEKIYDKILPWITNHPNYGLYGHAIDDGRPTCPNCGKNDLKKNGSYRTKAGIYQCYRCISCGAHPRTRQSEKIPKSVLTQAI